MKTTLHIDDTVMRRLKEEAARRGTTISALVESAVRLMLSRKEERKRLPPLPTFDGGRCRVDVSHHDALYRAMEER